MVLPDRHKQKASRQWARKHHVRLEDVRKKAVGVQEGEDEPTGDDQEESDPDISPSDPSVTSALPDYVDWSRNTDNWHPGTAIQEAPLPKSWQTRKPSGSLYARRPLESNAERYNEPEEREEEQVEELEEEPDLVDYKREPKNNVYAQHDNSDDRDDDRDEAAQRLVERHRGGAKPRPGGVTGMLATGPWQEDILKSAERDRTRKMLAGPAGRPEPRAHEEDVDVFLSTLNPEAKTTSKTIAQGPLPAEDVAFLDTLL